MSPSLKRELGQRIAILRRRAGLTQEQFAERTGYSVDFIGLIERGVNAPTLERLEDIATVLRVSVRDLFSAPSAERKRKLLKKSEK
jgi:transcriptional regulator with XRE-family HTH domain